MERESDFVDECYKDNDLTLLRKLTLVIPTYNRIFYLSRCLWYHAHFPFGQIIVADSSPEEKKIVNRDTVRKIREMFGVNILYLEYQSETEKYGGDIYRKWGDAIGHVETEYSQICTDKEFVIPTICCENITFLRENQDYVNAGGWKGYCVKSICSDKITYMFSPHSNHNIEPLIRLESFKNNQQILENLFQVYRTNQHKKIYQNFIKYLIDDIRYGEVTLELQPILMGLINKENTIGILRDLTGDYPNYFGKSKKSESSSSRYLLPFEYPETRRKIMQNRLVDCLMNTLSESNKNSNTRYIITSACNDILKWWMGKRISDGGKLRKLVRILWYNIPNNVKCILYHPLFRLGLIEKDWHVPQIHPKSSTLKVIKKIIMLNHSEQNSDSIITYLDSSTFR